MFSPNLRYEVVKSVFATPPLSKPTMYWKQTSCLRPELARISRCSTIESNDGTIWKTKSLRSSSSSGKQSRILMGESVGFKQYSMHLAHFLSVYLTQPSRIHSRVQMSCLEKALNFERLCVTAILIEKNLG